MRSDGAERRLHLASRLFPAWFEHCLIPLLHSPFVFKCRAEFPRILSQWNSTGLDKSHRRACLRPNQPIYVWFYSRDNMGKSSLAWAPGLSQALTTRLLFWDYFSALYRLEYNSLYRNNLFPHFSISFPSSRRCRRPRILALR